MTTPVPYILVTGMWVNTVVPSKIYQEINNLLEAIVVMLTTSRNDADRTRAKKFPIVKEYMCKLPTKDTFWQIAALIRPD